MPSETPKSTDPKETPKSEASKRQSPDSPSIDTQITRILEETKTERDITYRIEERDIVLIYRGAIAHWMARRPERGHGEVPFGERLRNEIALLKKEYEQHSRKKSVETALPRVHFPEGMEAGMQDSTLLLRYRQKSLGISHALLVGATDAQTVLNIERNAREFYNDVNKMETSQRRLDGVLQEPTLSLEATKAPLQEIGLTKETDAQLAREKTLLNGPEYPIIPVSEEGVRFLNQQFEKQHQKQIFEGDAIRLYKTQDSDWPFAFIVNDSETWNIRAYGPSNGKMCHITVILQKYGKDDRSVQTSFEATSSGLEYGKILQWMREAKQNQLNEREDRARVRQFDLPRNEPIGYICLTDEDHARSSSTKRQSTVLPETLSACGYTMVGGKELVTTVRGNPQEVLEQKIRTLYEKKVRHFYINLLAHGSTDGLAFPGKASAGSLPFQDLADVFSRYNDCTFTVNTIGCFGGGYAKGMKNFSDVEGMPEGRVTMFLQTKGHTVNYAFYNDILCGFLAKMRDGDADAPRTYGEAHYRADQYLKRTRFLDAEFWKSRPKKPSLRTAHIDREKEKDIPV